MRCALTLRTARQRQNSGSIGGPQTCQCQWAAAAAAASAMTELILGHCGSLSLRLPQAA